MSQTIFVSYGRGGRGEQQLNLLREDLATLKFEMVIDRSIVAGEDWRLSIDGLIRSAVAVIALIDAKSKESVYCHYEYGVAIGTGRPTIPILFDPKLDFSDIHPRLNALQALDFRDGFQVKTFHDRLRLLPLPNANDPLPHDPAFHALMDIIESTHGELSASDLLYSLASAKVITPQAYSRLADALLRQNAARRP